MTKPIQEDILRVMAEQMANPDGFNFNALAEVGGLVLLAENDPSAVLNAISSVSSALSNGIIALIKSQKNM
jgi:hypothetical protein